MYAVQSHTNDLYDNAQQGNAMAGQFFDGGMNAFGQSDGKLAS